MGEIRIVGPGKTRGYPHPVCKKRQVKLSILNVRSTKITFCYSASVNNRRLLPRNMAATAVEIYKVWESSSKSQYPAIP